MEQHILKTSVIFCIFLTQAHLLLCEPVGVVDMTTLTPLEEPPFVVHAVTTTEVSDSQNPTTIIPAPALKAEGSWLSKLLKRSAAADPSLVVEIDDANNDASLKILHLPLVRHQHNKTLISEVEEKTTTEVDNTPTHHKSKRQVPMNPRELKFRIFDRRIVQALVNAYAAIDPYRASLMQANVHRLIIKVALDEEGEWLKHYGFALRDLPFVVPGGMPGTPIPPQRKRRSLTETVNTEPQEPVEVEPTEAAEPAEALEKQEPVEVEPTEATEGGPNERRSGKAKRAIKGANPTEVESQEPVEVEPTQAAEPAEPVEKQEPVEVEPTEPVEVEPTEAVEPVEATEVEPKEPVETGKKGKAKRAIKTKDEPQGTESDTIDPKADVKPGIKVGIKRHMQAKDEKKQAETEIKNDKSKKKEKKQAEQESEEKQQQSKKQKRQAAEAPPPGEVETVTSTSVKTANPGLPGAATPFNPYACESICQQQAALQSVCATNGFCVHEFPSPCSLKIYSCKHPQLGFQIKNHGACIYTANVPRCIDLLAVS